MEDDPAQGVSIRLLDGTTRKVVRSEVMRVNYGDAAAAPPPPSPAPSAPVAVAPLAAPPLAPSGYGYGYGAPGALPALGARRDSEGHHVPALWITGLSLWSVTYLATIAITAGVARGDKGKAIGEACIPIAGPFVGLADGGDSLTGAERGGIITSLVLQQVGIALFVMGATIRVGGHDSSASIAPMPVRGGGGGAFVASF
jgi:hypothetical protein